MNRFWMPAKAMAVGLALALVLPLRADFRGLRSDPRQVRLVVPVETGAELGQLEPLVPDVQLIQVNGRDVLVLGSYRDARVAYQAGRQMQQRVRLTFMIIYPPDHPQANGLWLEELREQREQRQARSRGRQPVSEAARLGGPLTLSSVGLAASESLRVVPPPQPQRQATPPVAVGQAPSAGQPSRPAASPPLAGRLVAVNPTLHYLFARLDSRDQLAGLAQLLPVGDVTQRDGTVLAQVGLFSANRTGRQLLRQRQQLLARHGYRWTVLGAPL